jgi:hypothetical protein
MVARCGERRSKALKNADFWGFMANLRPFRVKNGNFYLGF